jgi:hypothetical protein
VLTGALSLSAGWWTGECRGKYGLFPGAFVELVSGGTTAAFAAPGTPEPDTNGSMSVDVNSNVDAHNNYGEPEPRTASSSMASLDGADGEVSEVLSYLEEGLQENGSPDDDAVRTLSSLVWRGGGDHEVS